MRKSVTGCPRSAGCSPRTAPRSSAGSAPDGATSAGAHLEFGHAVEVSAEGTYQQSATGDAEQFLTLRARLRQ